MQLLAWWCVCIVTAMVLLGCISALAIDVAYCYRRGNVVCLSVGLSVSLSLSLAIVSIVSPAKTAEPIEVPFGMWTPVGPRNHVLDGGPDPLWEGAILKGRRRSLYSIGTTVYVRRRYGLFVQLFDHLLYCICGFNRKLISVQR